MSVVRVAAAALLFLAAATRVVAGTSADINLPGLSDAERLEIILASFDRAQASIQTLHAEFSERKELAMLVEPIVSQGHFYYASPDQARWQYQEPDQRVFLISDNALLQYFPDKKILEKRDLRAANTSRVFKLFGLGQTSEDLTSFYKIALGEAGDDRGLYQLILTPKRRAVGKRLARVLLWVGDQDFLPRAMTYEEADGDITTLTFKDVEINTLLADGTFNLDVPDDVKISDTISIFSSSNGSSR